MSNENKGARSGAPKVTEPVTPVVTEPVTPVVTPEDAGRAVIVANFAKGYNSAKPGEPGYWTWETCAAAFYAARGVTFPNDDTARAVGRRAGKLLRGAYPNGAKLWGALVSKVATGEAEGRAIVDNVASVMLFAVTAGGI